MPDMDEEMRALARQTLDKLDTMSAGRGGCLPSASGALFINFDVVYDTVFRIYQPLSSKRNFR